MVARAIDARRLGYVALWFKTRGMDRRFYVYVTVAIAMSLVVYVRMRDTKRHSRIVED